ncbi:MAG: IclR family transcriptional regulator [Paracoccaceae bacterium]|nr:IclR family transcriptional regulator [Paracoccaceae bacterium]
MMTERRPRGRPKAFHDKTRQNTIQSLDRACGILAHLAEAQGLTLTELAGRLGQSPATVYRVLTTFEGHDMVELDPATQSWHVGAGAFRVGSAFLRRTNIVERARPMMQRLVDATGETANLGIRQGGQVLFLSQVETHRSIRAFFPPGTLSPLHASGIGKALLSAMENDAIRRLVREAGLEGFTAKTITGTERLLEDMAATRDRGYAIDDEERTTGMRCVAAPVRNAAGEAVAGISVSGPVSRITDAAIETFASDVVSVAAALSRSIGAPS